MSSTGIAEVQRGGLLGGVLPVRRATQAFMRRWIRRGVIASFGLGFSVPYFRLLNGVRVTGDGILRHLPRRRVVFLSNHQSYFLEAIAFFDLVYVRHQFDLEDPVVRFSAAEETMKRGLVTNLMGLAGGVTFKRSFRAEGVDVQRAVDVQGAERVEQAIREGWLLHFPAGTTRKGAPLRKGVARLLHNTRAVAVPVRVDGFRELLLHKQIPGKLFKRASLTLHSPLELDDFYSRPYDREVGAQILKRLEGLIGDPE
jgi:1-acyl-sn-glycerol-3-phosphate acyltransferase